MSTTIVAFILIEYLRMQMFLLLLLLQQLLFIINTFIIIDAGGGAIIVVLLTPEFSVLFYLKSSDSNPKKIKNWFKKTSQTFFVLKTDSNMQTHWLFFQCLGFFFFGGGVGGVIFPFSPSLDKDSREFFFSCITFLSIKRPFPAHHSWSQKELRTKWSPEQMMIFKFNMNRAPSKVTMKL